MRIRCPIDVPDLERCTLLRTLLGPELGQERRELLRVPTSSANPNIAFELHPIAQNHWVADLVAAGAECADRSPSEH